MKNTVNFVLKNKLAVWIMTVILIVTGIYSGTKMKMEILPELEIPYLIVNTMYIGGTPEEIDKTVTDPLEQRLKNITDLKTIKSTSSNNVSLLTLEFDFGVELEKAKADVQKEIDEVSKNFDENISDSELIEINLNSLPVYSISTSSEKLNPAEMSKIVEEDLLEKLTAVEGASAVEISGLTNEKVTMKYKQEVLAQYKVTEETIEKLIQANSLNFPLGLLEFEESEESVVVQGKIESLKELQNLPLPFRNQQGKNLLLSDFVEFEKTQSKETISRVNGEESLTLNIIKGQNANTVDVVNASKKVIKEFEEKNEEISINVLMDQGEPIEVSVETMLSKALFGALFAVFIIMLFLRDIKSTFISIISIPVSLLLSLTVLHKLGITLNTMTLGAMTVAIGRVIDDSIVVVENIYRRINDKNEILKGRELIKEATLEMFVPILSSTMVTIAVFLPLGLVGGVIGQLFLPFALAMAFSLLASLLVAITIVPALAHSLFKKELAGKGKEHKMKRSNLTNLYTKGLKWTLNHKMITLIISLLLVAGSIALAPKLGFGFLPSEANKQWALTYVPESGEKEDSIEKALSTTEKYLLTVDEIEQFQSTLGSTGGLLSLGSADGGITITFKDEALENDIEKTKEEILNGIKETEIKGEWAEQQQGPSSSVNSNQLSYSLYGKTIDDLKVATKQVEKIMNKNKDVKNVASDVSEVYQENRLVIDEEKVAAYGLSTAQVGMSLSTLSRDKEVTKLFEDGKEIKVIIKGENKSYKNMNEILENELINNNGIIVKVKDVVKVEETTTVSSITKDDGKLVATVSGEVLTDDVNSVSTELKKGIEELDLPKGVELVEGGVAAQMTEAFVQLGLAMLAAIGIVYLLLVLTFKEGMAPFTILFSLPLTIIGVVLIIFITGLTVDVSAMLGLLMLIGIVVTNAIVLIDRVLKNEYNGMEIREAIIEGATTRLRPILMTAIATIGALLPLAFGTEGGGLISQGLGVTVIGGLISSTILTLFIVPVVYELLSKIMKKDRKNINWN